MRRSIISLAPLFLCLLLVPFIVVGCKKKSGNGDQPAPVAPVVVVPVKPLKTDVAFWLTTPDQFSLFQKQNESLVFTATTNQFPSVEVDTAQTFQTIDGFGYTLTGGSASLINALPASAKDAVLRDLFAVDSTYIGVSYLRISIGASDLSASAFTYNDIPVGQTDPDLLQFSIDKERTDLVPVLKKILAIYPGMKILGSPWSAPLWMKTSAAFVGGSLKPEYYPTYARYFVKYLQAMQAEGITIDAITPQNEPLHGGNNPSMVMTATEQATFIKNHLGPALRAAGLQTKIIIYDHNADRPDYPLTVLNDAAARPFVDGSAFHLYAGNISALSQVRDAYPDKNIYFTEQWVGGPGNFAGDLKWHVENLVIGATRNWSRNVLEWNLAADPLYRPYTAGGCSTCLGALTVGASVLKNVSYYVIAHASKFVRPGSVRIASNLPAGLPNVAFKTPEGKKVLIVLNTSATVQNFNIKFNGKLVTSSLAGGAVGTYTW
ncbi:glycoside hydrolase family 30 protein [Hufsiella ginkgonis]|uniref:Glucosylceramidase n=1 Tax=Hufsiella ginkgonis TaxID=2695274 RepID=A0A7K1Y1I9_9SPHI|nr:glycoside hydrolase family 30 beta sandwich domain-containing protein [Hufsiella ginkgonis]MXV17091.1 glucosylceramidase [Hufsiella ginkgonis]